LKRRAVLLSLPVPQQVRGIKIFMKNKVIANIIYSAAITFVIEVILVLVLSGTILQNSVMEILLFVSLGIVLFAVIFWLFLRRSYDYITKINDAVRDIAAGKLDTRLDIEGDNEFSEIALDINNMAGDIKKLMDKERESERTKNELITNIAHDLRTPLTSIIGYLELLSLKTDIPEEQRRQYTDIAYTKARKLQKLIEDLFGFTKLTYGKIAMKVERIDIVKLLSQMMDEFYPGFMEKGLKYELTSNVNSAVISADGTLIARLFDNLINNAIKYGSDGKRIDVKIHASQQTVDIAVINYGKVIPEEELPHLFEKFYRVEQSRNKNTGGTGLGLAIAKSIVDMHDGQIHVESDLRGTRFIVRLKVNFDENREHFESTDI